MPEVITNNLDLWTSALLTKSSAGRGSNGKQEAYGIKKLRELIYELAAKGLLVDHTSDSAAKTVKIGDVADLVMGQAPPGNECNKDGVGTIFVKTGEFGDLYPEVVEWTTKPLKLAKVGDVLICVVGATVGKLNLAIDCAIGRSVAAIRPRGDIDTKYLYFSLMPYTLKLRNQSRGSAQGVIGKDELNAVEIRLPSLKEQHRIVAKVDELMALCDRLEQQQTHSLEAHQTLVESLLGTLVRPSSVRAELVEARPSTGSGRTAHGSARTEFEAAWTRIASHFDTLFTTEHSIDQLKQTILQLAVMGKLVPQDPDDEPAEALLVRVNAAKEQLIVERKIRQSDEAELSEPNELFDVPVGWLWVHVKDVAIVQGGKRLPNGAALLETPTPHIYIRVTDMKNGTVSETGLMYISPEVQRLISRYTINKEDLYITIAGTIGDVGFIPDALDGQNLTENAAKIVFRILDKRFFQFALSSDFVQAQFLEKTKQMAQPKLALKRIAGAKFCLPPLNEQHRIVAKVDELMALCDALKARTKDAQATQLHLADAIVEQAVV